MGKEKKKVLIVIYVKNDFVYGSLGTPEAQEVIPNIKKKFDKYKNNNDYVIFTKDTHDSDYLATAEGKKLPVEHCIRGTSGWEIVDEIIKVSKISITLWYVVNLLLDLMIGIGKKHLIS